MVYVLAKLKVESYENWKTFFDERSATRGERGSKEAHLFRNSEDQHEVVILFIWEDLESARLYMESDNLREYLKTAGAEISEITYLDEQETST
jgi:heme-degrading monooxygenase HmoA